MIYFKDDGGKVFAYENEADRNKFGPAGLVRMTQEEVDAHLNPAPTYSQALAALNAAYQLDVDTFNRAFAIAYLSDGPEQEAKQAIIRTQYEARKNQHAANVTALKTQYGIGD
jgi:hypothetical protein